VNRASFLNRKRLSSGKHFFRCYLDEPQACRIALTTLSGLGHTTIGTPHFLSKQYDWIGQRIKTIQREAAKIRPAPTICDVQHREQFWGFDVVPDLQQFKKNLSLNRFTVQIDRLRNIRRKIPFGEELLSNPQSLLGLCRISGLTAIIAPDDNIAQEIFLFLQAFGIAIPGDMSLISFDNVSTSRYFPITTVDFGFSQAGFKVAHVFIGDMAVPVDSYGAIHTRCALVDRGSIGKPRRGELVLPFEIFPSA